MPRRMLAPLLLLVLLASACTVRFDTAVELTENDTATVTIDFGIRFEGDIPGAEDGMDELNPEDSQDDLEALAGQCGFDASAVSAEELTEDDFMGVSITLADIPISAVNCFLGEDVDSPFDRFSITRDGDNYVFDGAIDVDALLNEAGGGFGQKRNVEVAQAAPTVPDDVLEQLPEDAQQQIQDAQDQADQALEEAGEQLDEALDQLDDEFGEFGDDLEQGFEDAFGGTDTTLEATVSITFPGAVGDNNATRVEGNTAIWDLELGQPIEMMAVGSAVPGGGGGNLLLFIIIGVVVLLLLGALAFFLSRRGKGDQPAFAGAPGAPQGGFGGPGAPQGGFGAPGAPQGGFGAPGAPQGGFGAPPGAGAPPPPQQPQAPQQGGFGTPPGAGAPPPPQQGGFGTPPGAGAPPPPQQPQAPQPPQQPEPPAGGDQGGGGGFDPGSTRTFRPEDLLPPEDPNQR